MTIKEKLIKAQREAAKKVLKTCTQDELLCEHGRLLCEISRAKLDRRKATNERVAIKLITDELMSRIKREPCDQELIEEKAHGIKTAREMLS